jgi:hypothetical protein
VTARFDFVHCHADSYPHLTPSAACPSVAGIGSSARQMSLCGGARRKEAEVHPYQAVQQDRKAMVLWRFGFHRVQTRNVASWG